ncbi:hypothetical protein RB595_007268 [Gaeumannomyces hyphopodioides]
MVFYRNAWRDTISSKLLNSWISTCDSRHRGVCHHIPPSEFLPPPPRITLIDLERQRLVVVSAAESYRYVALSYVWGDTSGQLATTKANFEHLQQDSQLSHTHHSLPATVRDAMLFAKRLGVLYIWVDRFCIVQDDAEAKAESISWMASIYAHAYLTIVAASSVDANAGIKGIGSPSGPRRCEDTSFCFEDVECGTGQLETNTSRWYTRGWTFQERAVSRRSLVLYESTAMWECQKELYYETIDTFDREDDSQTQYNDSQATIALRPTPDIRQYRILCEGYSTRDLGFQEDALNAFSSTLSVLGQGFAGGFFYALPELVFSQALGWRPRGPIERRSQFPQWSWLGWRGPIEMALKTAWDGVAPQPMARWERQDLSAGGYVDIEDGYHKWTSDERESGWRDPRHRDHPRYASRASQPSDASYALSKTSRAASAHRIRGTVQVRSFTAGDVRPRGVFGGGGKGPGLVCVELIDKAGFLAGEVEVLESELARLRPGMECSVFALHRDYHQNGPHRRPQHYGIRTVVVVYFKMIAEEGQPPTAYRMGVGDVREGFWDDSDEANEKGERKIWFA